MADTLETALAAFEKQRSKLRTWCLDTLTTKKLPKLSGGKETPYGDTIEALLQRLAPPATSGSITGVKK
jgi:hypothetical protein